MTWTVISSRTEHNVPVDDGGEEKRREIRVRGGLGERDTKRWEDVGRETKFHSVLQDTRM